MTRRKVMDFKIMYNSATNFASVGIVHVLWATYLELS